MSQLLYAHGDVMHPLPDTIRTLDEIVTDFIQGVAFEASRAAHHKGRQKLKLEDFEFALRKNPAFLGKVQEVFEKKGEIDRAKKAFNTDDDVDLARGAAAAAAVVAAAAAAAAAPATATTTAAASSEDPTTVALGPASTVGSVAAAAPRRPRVGSAVTPGLASASFSNTVFVLGRVEEDLGEGDDDEEIKI